MMNTTETTTAVTLHNPSSCTCGRLVWLSLHCDRFTLTFGTRECEARIEAALGSACSDLPFQPENLKEAVAEVFWQMWHAWQPAEGMKVTGEARP